MNSSVVGRMPGSHGHNSDKLHPRKTHAALHDHGDTLRGKPPRSYEAGFCYIRLARSIRIKRSRRMGRFQLIQSGFGSCRPFHLAPFALQKESRVLRKRHPAFSLLLPFLGVRSVMSAIAQISKGFRRMLSTSQNSAMEWAILGRTPCIWHPDI